MQGEKKQPYLCPPELALAQREGMMAEEEGRVGEWKKLGSFPQCTSADCRKMESRGGGQRVLQSGGEGWDHKEGQDAKGKEWGGGHV